MPNGPEANLSRLEMCIAVYRAKHGVWPTHVRFTPPFLRNMASIIGPDGLERLATLMELRTERERGEEFGISVGGRAGVERYDEIDRTFLIPESIAEVRSWLAIHHPR